MREKIRYEPSPAHKWGTTEAGPPKWNPHKERCPRDLTMDLTGALLRRSVTDPKGDDPARRWAVRRGDGGLEFFESKLTIVDPDGTVVVHGHPTRRVPPRVLRRLRDDGSLSDAEYRKVIRELN